MLSSLAPSRGLSLIAIFCLAGLFAETSSAAPPNRKLLKKVSLNVDEKPYLEVLEDLASEHDLLIQYAAFDETATPQITVKELREAEGEVKFLLEQKVTMHVENVTLQSVLDLLDFGNMWLTYTADSKGLYVMATSDEWMYLFNKSYNVASLGPLMANPQVFAEVVMRVTSGPWEDFEDVGGKFIALNARSMTVSQSFGVHQEIEAALAELAAVVRGRPAAGKSPIEAANQRITLALTKPATFPEGATTVKEVLQAMLTEAEINFFVDRIALSNDGLTIDLEVMPIAEKKPALDLLNEVLSQHELIAFVDHEVVCVTTRLNYEETGMVVRAYDIRKLLSPTMGPLEVAAAIRGIEGTGPWVENEGIGGSAEGIGPIVVVRHLPIVQEKIAAALNGQ